MYLGTKNLVFMTLSVFKYYGLAFDSYGGACWREGIYTTAGLNVLLLS